MTKNKALYEFMEYLPFLKELVKRDFKMKYYKSFLGVLWTLLNPLILATIMTIIFSTLFKGLLNTILFIIFQVILY